MSQMSHVLIYHSLKYHIIIFFSINSPYDNVTPWVCGCASCGSVTDSGCSTLPELNWLTKPSMVNAVVLGLLYSIYYIDAQISRA